MYVAVFQQIIVVDKLHYYQKEEGELNMIQECTFQLTPEVGMRLICSCLMPFVVLVSDHGDCVQVLRLPSVNMVKTVILYPLSGNELTLFHQRSNMKDLLHNGYSSTWEGKD